MRRLLMTSVAAVGLATGIGASAFAADLPVYTKAPPLAPYYNWTGFYVGADIGYAWKDPTVTFTPNDSVAANFLNGGIGGPVAPISFNDHGVIGGADVGYNWQFNRSWLVGIETDFNVASLEGQGTSSTLGGPSGPVCDKNNIRDNDCAGRLVSADQEIMWFGTLRARAGWLATNDLLLYGTGGFAYGKISESVIASNNGPTPYSNSNGVVSVVCASGGVCYQGSSDFIGTGWTAGGGMEYHVPGSAASIKLEYLFVDLGSGGVVNAIAQKVVAWTGASSFGANYPNVEFNTVKLGVNWKFQ
jgi:outer membrane immunogenic protein